MAATMTGLPLPGYNCYNRDGEADGGGKMECMSFMAATTTGSPVKDLPGHNTVEMTVVRKWALHSHDAIPTMSTHNPDGYGVGTSNVSLMSCFLFFLHSDVLLRMPLTGYESTIKGQSEGQMRQCCYHT